MSKQRKQPKQPTEPKIVTATPQACPSCGKPSAELPWPPPYKSLAFGGTTPSGEPYDRVQWSRLVCVCGQGFTLRQCLKEPDDG